MPKAIPAPITAHFQQFSSKQKHTLQALRQLFLSLLPEYADETISYGMPAFKFDKKALWYAGWKKHYSVYFIPQIMAQYKKKLKTFKTTKSAINIPWETAIPEKLLTQMTNTLITQAGFYKKAANITKPSKATKKTCAQGHQFTKSSDCPTCPICEKSKTPKGFLHLLSAPARRALENHNITTLTTLAKHAEQDLLALHGFGPASLPALRTALKTAGLSFKKAVS